MITILTIHIYEFLFGLIIADDALMILRLLGFLELFAEIAAGICGLVILGLKLTGASNTRSN